MHVLMHIDNFSLMMVCLLRRRQDHDSQVCMVGYVNMDYLDGRSFRSFAYIYSHALCMHNRQQRDRKYDCESGPFCPGWLLREGVSCALSINRYKLPN
jgi:hypothetical protein